MPVLAQWRRPTGLTALWRHRAGVWLVALLGLGACASGPPAGVSAVTPFDIQRYAGRWYEIARLDHSFERGLCDVTANYRLRPDGDVEVINRGYDIQRNEWRELTGRAVFIGDTNRGSLKVSFFWPFYGGYHVAALDRQNYRWALVIGPSRDYFWILAREKTLPKETMEDLLKQASALGIATEKLIRVEHTRAD